MGVEDGALVPDEAEKAAEAFNQQQEAAREAINTTQPESNVVSSQIESPAKVTLDMFKWNNGLSHEEKLEILESAMDFEEERARSTMADELRQPHEASLQALHKMYAQEQKQSGNL